MRLINHQVPTPKSNILPLLTVILFATNLLALGLLMFNASMLNGITSRLPQVLGQLIDGKSITLAPQEYNQRHPESIRRFVGETLTLMFTWSQNKSPQNTLNWTLGLFSQSLHNQLRREILPSGNVENVESILLIESISQPQLINPGVWQLDVKARQVVFLNQDMNGKTVDWHKKIIVKTLENPDLNSSEETTSSLKQAVYNLTKVQLLITNICEVNVQKCQI